MEQEKSAIALKYDAASGKAPEVSAKGTGKVANDIVAMAEEMGIYVHRDPVLLKNLENLKEGETIPKPLFLIISEIIAYSYFLQGKTPEMWRDSQGVHVNMKG
ncbi:EscU/YscU/HrcU family type III secretion system export apparatus switch protein [Succinimonas sp.]|uniref:EscU/YscU/HrcU family type III secretion system export apparatus switch protein n=1 Tax=Succinimonas sp. TaxID=1936151 RepID=UPI00386778BA